MAIAPIRFTPPFACLPFFAGPGRFLAKQTEDSGR